MDDTHSPAQSGKRPAGDKCLVARGGYWDPATVTDANPDGTYSVQFDDHKRFLPIRYGVTRAEVSFDDEMLWDTAFLRASSDASTMSLSDFLEALTVLGYDARHLSEFEEMWSKQCSLVYTDETIAPLKRRLDKQSAYKLFRFVRVSAKSYLQFLDATKPAYATFYHNEVRCGGRDPSEISRRVTVSDSLAALGLQENAVDEAMLAKLQDVEAREGVRLPHALIEIFSKSQAADAITHCHPSDFDGLGSSNWHSTIDQPWSLQRGLRSFGLDGAFSICIVTRDWSWAAVFDDNEPDARVYLMQDYGYDFEQWQLVAPTVSMFLWDLAQTGFIWLQHNGSRSAQNTDIGLAASAPAKVEPHSGMWWDR